jgi:DnaA family protein
MRQIPLDVRLADHAVFEAFYPGSNAVVLASLRELAARPARALLWLWGARSSGRSHLLQAAVAAAGKGGERSAYLPIGSIRGLGPGAIEGFGEARLVAIDDVDLVAGDLDWEHALFGLYEALHASGGRLVTAAATPPAQSAFRLPDLKSRFSASAVFRLQPLTDEDSMRALQLRASLRGLTVPEDTARYLIARVERSLPALFALLDRLDRAALTAQRPLTVPFVRAILEAGTTSGGIDADR